METLAEQIRMLDPIWVYAAIASIAYIENFFPPFPSDVVVAASGALIIFGKINFVIALLTASIGSTLGFLTMYQIGKWLDIKVIEQGKIKFLPLDKVHVVEGWFARYGYGVVIANRFLSGTRAVVAFFAGMSHLKYIPTLILSFLSSVVWDVLLLYFGYSLGEHWQDITIYLDLYGKVITAIIVLVLVVVILYQMYRKRKNSKSTKKQ